MNSKFNFFSFFYGVYAWFIFLVCVIVALFGAIILPSLKLRRAWVKKSAYSVFLLCGIKMDITGQENLPVGNALIVANHASYLDGIILHAVLPTKFTFVIKSEMQSVPIANFLFNRVGSRFVERFQSTGSFRDARKLIKAGADGEPLAIFPEGTFTEKPGLDRFRTGAFVTAIKSKMPLVPLVINGSRKILPANKFLPNIGNLSIHILEAINTHHKSFDSSKELKKLSRERILKVLDEPDLLQSE